MAKSRTCDRCGTRMSPWIPRGRSGENMLCKGCQHASARERTSAMQSGPDPVPDRTPAGQMSLDFGWDNDLGPEGHHPLAAPLPNSIWERYAKKQALRARPVVPVRALGEVRANSRRSRPKPKSSSLHTAHQGHGQDHEAHGEPVHPIPQSAASAGQHLVEHHGIAAQDLPATNALEMHHDSLHAMDGPHTSDHSGHLHHPNTLPVLPHVHPGIAEDHTALSPMAQHLKDAHSFGHHQAILMQNTKGFHDKLHQDPQNHSHGHVAEQAAAPVHSHGQMSHAEMTQHLLDNHGLKPAGVEHVQNGTLGSGAATAGENLATWHHKHHTTFNVSGGTSHEHPNGSDIGVTEPEGPVKMNHPNGLSTQSLGSHLKVHHGITPEQLNAALIGSTQGHDEVYTGLHHMAHSFGHADVPHEHNDYTPEHPKLVGDEQHAGHLKVHHGYSESDLENIPQGGLEAQHNAHHDPTSPLALKAGAADHDHSAHSDVGKFFSGAEPPHQTALVAHAKTPKAQGGHGLGMDQLPSAHLPANAPDAAYHKAWEDWHDAAHTTGTHPDGTPVQGGLAEHQHVPTTEDGVKTPKQIQNEKITEHLKTHHGITVPVGDSVQGTHSGAHEPDAFNYHGHPGHDHAPDSNGMETETVNQLGGAAYPPFPGSKVPKAKLHHPHAADMTPHELNLHMIGHKKQGDASGKLDPFEDMLDGLGGTHGQALQQHAQHHATGDVNDAHTHEGPVDKPSPLDGSRFSGGKEPEPHFDEHPHPESESQALAHIVSKHPNVTLNDFKTSPYADKKSGMQQWHNALHSPDNENAHAAPDGHTHIAPQGPNTGIAIGSHLVHEHGLPQHVVAGMTPAEFKAYHEDQHVKHDEEDLGHGHMHPGGPSRAPITSALNPHHAEMRDSLEHPAVHEWYHGTSSSDFDDAPMNATELREHHDRWGNYGGGDWNNHAGTHWTSLHQMAQGFGSGRVIHAKLHMRNPIKYNSLNHMSHDAYDRLHASGDMEDGGHFLGRHDDDNGYNTCCSDALLHYAKGGHRSDGKFGMERYRDSLRASGHDGIVVRNQADSPEGHWNAIPLSADDVEITNGHCYPSTPHHDERDGDKDEFYANKNKLNAGWQHPKPFDAKDYTDGKDLPDEDQVSGANRVKRQVNPPKHLKVAGSPPRGDADFHGEHTDEGDDDNENDQWCEHCDEHTDHDTDDCQENKWCNVCEQHGDHTTDENHSECEHCGDYADHDTDEHQDEYGEHPDTMKLDGYCPHCDTADKENYNKTECENCGEDLPKWKTLQTQGQPLAKGEYKNPGYSPSDNTEMGLAEDAHKTATSSDLAKHLYHHHHSDPGIKAFEETDAGTTDWDHGAMSLHHQHLHAEPEWAKSQGFKATGMNGHTHKQEFGEFKSHEDMTPEEMHAHLLTGHLHNQGHHNSTMSLHEILGMDSADAHEAHKHLHEADDAVEWGETDGSGDAISKLKHAHNGIIGKSGANPTFTPQGDDLAAHIKSDHKMSGHIVNKLSDKPKVIEAMHQQFHDSWGPAADPHGATFHTHGQDWADEQVQKASLSAHLQSHHGGAHNVGSLASMVKQHGDSHAPGAPFYVKSGTPHEHHAEDLGSGKINNDEPLYGEDHEHEHISKEPFGPSKPNVALKPHGLESHMFDPDHKHLPTGMAAGWNYASDSPAYAKAHAAAEAEHELHHKLHGKDIDHVHEGPKTSSRRTLTDLFAEAAV